MTHEPGQLAYETRFIGFTLGPRGIAPPWDELLVEHKRIWERIERVVEERAANTVWRLQVQAETETQAVAISEPRPDPREVGESLGFHRGVMPASNFIAIEAGQSVAREVAHPASTVTTNRDQARAAGFTGDMCDLCGSMRVIRTGKCTTCQDCSASGGCG